jgi:hypothetical protein
MDEKPTVSVITCFNNRKTLEINLKSSLESQQRIQYEFLGYDNSGGNSAFIPEALNTAAETAHGETLVFAHQDIFLMGNNWLYRMAENLQTLERYGAAGVAGVDKEGRRYGFILDRGRMWGRPVTHASLVQTLDEQLLVTPRSLFLTVKFDKRFKFHSYFSDYCLSVGSLGYRAYVLGLPVEHNSISVDILRASSLDSEDRFLVKKHKDLGGPVHKTTGTANVFGQISRITRALVQKNLYTEPLVFLSKEALGHSLPAVLDLGCIPLEQSVVERIVRSTYSVGVSTNLRYLDASRRLGTHSDYVCAAPTNLPFKLSGIGGILVFGLLEYIEKPEAKSILSSLGKTNSALVIKTPNNGAKIGSNYLVFKSSWQQEDFEAIGLHVCSVGPNSRLIPHFLVAVRSELKEPCRK